MSNQKYIHILEIITSPECEEPLVAFLDTWPACNWAVEQLVNSPSVSVKVYFSDPPDRERIEGELRRFFQDMADLEIPANPARIQFSVISDEDWQNSWRTHFSAFKAGERLVIKPSWEDWRPSGDEVVLVCDPGMAFGTGQHPTTRFCLMMIEQHVDRTSSVLDIGCGSAILAIAAAKLGANGVDAFDNDSTALEHAQHLVDINGVNNIVSLYQADIATVKPRKKYSLVVANLYAEMLIQYRHEISAPVEKDGFLAVSGILTKKADEVKHAYVEIGMQLRSAFSENEWCGFLFSY